MSTGLIFSKYIMFLYLHKLSTAALVYLVKGVGNVVMTEERDDKIGTSKIYLSRILGGPARHEKTTNNTGFIKTVIEANIAN